MDHTYRLVIACPDRVGIVARVSQFIAEHGGWLTEAAYHTDTGSGWFFMRNEIKADSLGVDLEEFRRRFEAVAQEFQMQWSMRDSTQRRRVLILASHASHCLADILYRWHSQDLYTDIVGVVANHDNLRSMVEWYDIPYHNVPISREPREKELAFQQIDRLVEDAQADTIVLARFMQILPAWMCRKYSGRAINIHHSFLPSFIGANPYQKAYDRGVKLIGATCHYVTDQLDEGPIIDQDVIRISHSHSKDDMVRLGKDVEKAVLARGLRNHLEDRVIIHGNKTIVFD